MDKLWAPWRSKYIYMRKRKRCIFCGNARAPAARDKARYIVNRSKHAFSILNLYPYNNGHIMVAPFRHVADLEHLTADKLMDMIQLMTRDKKLLDKMLKPQGYNIGINIGKVSGAGYDGHIHIHIVPRWTGDTNYMTVTAGMKIISESLDVLYKLLKMG